jgi:hypothetical protein
VWVMLLLNGSFSGFALYKILLKNTEVGKRS